MNMSVWRISWITSLVIIAMGMASSPALADIGMVIDSGGDIIVFDPSTDTVLGSIPSPSRFGFSGDVEITADEKLGFFARERTEIWVIDLVNIQLAAGINPIPICTQANDLAITADQAIPIAIMTRSRVPVEETPVEKRMLVASRPA